LGTYYSLLSTDSYPYTLQGYYFDGYRPNCDR